MLQTLLNALQEGKQRATAAAAAAAAAQGKRDTNTVTETRRFAGKDIEVQNLLNCQCPP